MIDTYLFGLLGNKEKFKNQTRFDYPEINSKLLKFDINNFEDGDEITETFLVSSFEKKLASNKKPYLDIKLGNGLNAKMFDENWKLKLSNLVETTINYLENHTKVLEITGTVNEYPKGSGNKSINVEKFKKGEANPFDLLSTTDEDVVDLVNEFYYYVNKLEEPYLSVAYLILDKYWHEFSIRPAALGHHHNYLCGLLKHTTCMLRLSWWLSENPIEKIEQIIHKFSEMSLKEIINTKEEETPIRSRDLVLNGVDDHLRDTLLKLLEKMKEQEEFNVNVLVLATMIHDFGKIWEYQHVGEDKKKFELLYPHLDWSDLEICQSGIAMDQIGKEVGHIPFAKEILIQATKEVKYNFSGKDFIKIIHCVESHHGKPEWGSKTPNSTEAWLLHIIDFIDARYEKYEAKKTNK